LNMIKSEKYGTSGHTMAKLTQLATPMAILMLHTNMLVAMSMGIMPLDDLSSLSNANLLSLLRHKLQHYY
jgi:hypothetical protein